MISDWTKTQSCSLLSLVAASFIDLKPVPPSRQLKINPAPLPGAASTLSQTFSTQVFLHHLWQFLFQKYPQLIGSGRLKKVQDHGFQ